MMIQRNPIAVALLPFVTFGIYSIVWYVKTKGELNQRLGASNTIPTAWLIIVPVVGYYWMWKFAEGASVVNNGAFSAIVSFLLLLFLGPIGAAIIQSSLNGAAVAGPVDASTPAATQEVYGQPQGVAPVSVEQVAQPAVQPQQFAQDPQAVAQPAQPQSFDAFQQQQPQAVAQPDYQQPAPVAQDPNFQPQQATNINGQEQGGVPPQQNTF